MKYQKVRPNSYIWLNWLYTVYFITLILSVLLELLTGKKWLILITGVMVGFGILYIKAARKKLIKARDISRLIHKHIRGNELYQTETKGRKNREVYTFYPEVYWRIDKSLNTLFIRFIKEKSGSIHVCRTEIHYSEEDEQGNRKNVVKVQNSQKHL